MQGEAPERVSPSDTPQFVIARPAAPVPIVTYTLIGANVLVYLAMGLSGVSWTEPSIPDALRWGADFGPLSLSGQWWRLFTSTFVHFGIIHIAFNMWCLYSLGRSLEFLMGRKAFAATYVASGMAASAVSLGWRPMGVSAGASGAIFGIAGAFASYVYLKRVALTPQSIQQTQKSLAIFIIYNLVWGAAKGGVDNSAHVGGLLAGAVLGAIVPPVLRFRTRKDVVPMPGFPPDRAEEESHANRIAWGIICGSTIVLGIGLVGVHSFRLPYANYGQAAKLVRGGQVDQGIATLQKLVDSGADMPLAPMLLGEIQLDQGNPAAAITPLQRTIAADPSDLQSVQNLALSYIGTNRPAEALVEIAKVISYEASKPAWDAVFIRAIAEGENADYVSANQDLQSVLRANSELTEARDDLARFQGLANHDPETKLVPLQIPYAKLVVKSDEWPLFP
ncbi:MAG TPA: rhomboid family intramembrane serine protease [Candidatus Acidoferrum sp.]|jgi:rhomboid protease GluP|nr:rhomboid family intramembrane serine protease [Candidatus Acidoferrum sp.]